MKIRSFGDPASMYSYEKSRDRRGQDETDLDLGHLRSRYRPNVYVEKRDRKIKDKRKEKRRCRCRTEWGFLWKVRALQLREALGYSSSGGAVFILTEPVCGQRTLSRCMCEGGGGCRIMKSWTVT
jgi:hypothetical protein